MIVFCAESYILAKFTKLSQLELLFWIRYAPNRLSVGALPQTPLGSLERYPDTIVAFRWPTSKGRKVEQGKGKVGEVGSERKREERGGIGSSARPLFRCFRRLWALASKNWLSRGVVKIPRF